MGLCERFLHHLCPCKKNFFFSVGHHVGASFTLLCHLYCKLSHSVGAFLTFWQNLHNLCLCCTFFFQGLRCCQRLFLIFLPAGSLSKPGLWILHVVLFVVLRKRAFYIHWGTWNRVSSVSVTEGSWLAVGSFNYCYLSVR